MPNVHHSDFHTKKPVLTTKYYDKSPGELDVLRLISGEHCWERSGLAEKTVQKAIILADWTAPYWQTSKSNQVTLAIQQLLEDKFNIYFWQQNRLCRLNNPGDSIWNKITPTSDETLFRAAFEQYRLLPNQIIVLDYHALPLLFGKPRIDRHCMLAEDISLIELNGQQIKMVDPEFSEIRQVTNYNRYDDKFDEYYSGISITQREEDHLDYDEGIWHDTVSRFRKILSDDASGDEKRNRETKTHALKLSSAYENGIEDVNFCFDDFNWHSLKKISLQNVSLNICSLFTIDSLRFVSLKGVRSSLKTAAKPLLELKFTQIWQLELDDLKFALSSLCLCEQLRSLRLSKLNAGQLSDLFSGRFILNHLSTIEIEIDEKEGAIMAVLPSIRSCAPNLSSLKLKLNGFNSGEYLGSMTSPLFNEDTEVDLEFTNVYIDKITMFCLFFKNIKSLKMKRCLGDQNTLLQAQSNLIQLESLELERCSNLDNDLFKDLSLNVLKTLKIDHCKQISYEALDCLLAKNNKLKRIDLSCIGGEGFGCGEPIPIPDELEYLELDLIDESYLFKLTKNLTKLKHLNLFHLNAAHVPVLKYLITNNKEITNLDIRIDEDLFDPELEEMTRCIMEVNHEAPQDDYDYDYDYEDEDVESSITVDLDTIDDGQGFFNLKKIFYPDSEEDISPRVSSYRLNTYNNVSFEKGQFKLENVGDLKLVDLSMLEQPVVMDECSSSFMHESMRTGITSGSSEPKHLSYTGIQLIKKLDEVWMPIASLHPNEVLLSWETVPQKAIEIKYSLRDNLYYVRSKEEKVTFTLHFKMSYAPPAVKHLISEQFKAMVEYFKTFTSGNLEPDETGSIQDSVNAIFTRKIGACRHRSVAFFCVLKEHFPSIPARIISNDCHMYVEIHQDNVWIRCDLGGYPSTITVSEDVSRLIESARAEASKDGMSLTMPPELGVMETESSIQISKAFDSQQFQQEFSGPFDSLTDYVRALFTDVSKKKRIDLPESLILQFQCTLQMQANQHNHPVFFVHGPDDLVCSNSFIAVSRDGVSGELRPGPGGALHDFIIQYSDAYEGPCPILVINYSAFSGEDLASWNHVLSNLRLTDSTKLPSNTILLGLFDPRKGLNYDPSDFDCRFDSIHQAPLHLLNKETYDLPKPIWDDVLISSRTTINLGHSPRWKSQLLDHWILKNGKLWLAEGELSKARKTGQSIEILNPPEDEGFLRYWSLSNFEASKALNISFNEGYSWLWDKTRIQRTTAASPNAHIINPSQLVKFINPYKLVDGQLSQSSGIIADHFEGTLHLYITRDLSEDEWVIFYKEYMKYPNISLSFACAEAVACPPGLEDVSCVSTTSEVSCASHHTQWILTNDMDLTLQSVTDIKKWDILDVTECLSADILTRMDCKDRALYLFAEEKGALLTAISSSKNIILMGDFSDSMIDDLAPFLIERLNAELVLGNVLVISEKKFPYLTPAAQHQFGWEDKELALKALFSTERLEYKTTAFQTLPYIKQCTALAYETNYPDRPYLRAWDGLMTLRSGIRLAPFDIKTSLDEAKNFSISRKVQFEEAFYKWPYIVISGLTGVGKTTFIEHYFKKNLYQGSDINTLISWATYQADEPIVLFIDESNLLSRDWSEFEGLFHPQPNVLIDGKVYPLSVHHKVIFAGNPISYSADRKMARLFDRHGCSVVFEPLSTAFIYEYIIKPIFADTPICLEAQSIIGETLLNVYQFIIETSEDSVLISPREVQMMALLVVQDISNHVSQYNSKESIKRISNYHAYYIGQNLVLTQHKSLFDLLFKPTETIYRIENKSETDFVYTETRSQVRHMLSNYLELRAHRQKSMMESVSMNDSQLYGGIGAFVIEGESSIGKKSLVGDVLNSFKLRLNHDYETITPSTPFIEKKKILLDAFNNGRVVIMEEFNTSPMMEQLLNSLLMGKTPEGIRPISPGFFVIGIQKSATTAGRTLPSNALARRIQTCHLPAYTNEELDHILLTKGVVDAALRETLIAVYNRKRLEARSNPLLMTPTFAHLMAVAELYITKKRKLDLSYSESKTKFFKSADPDDYEPESCERGMGVGFSAVV